MLLRCCAHWIFEGSPKPCSPLPLRPVAFLFSVDGTGRFFSWTGFGSSLGCIFSFVRLFGDFQVQSWDKELRTQRNNRREKSKQTQETGGVSEDPWEAGVVDPFAFPLYFFRLLDDYVAAIAMWWYFLMSGYLSPRQWCKEKVSL